MLKPQCGSWPALSGPRPITFLYASERRWASPLKAYITELRIEAAKWLLIEAGEKIEAAALRVGLHDASHLSRLFVRYAGTRPGAYRRSIVPAS